MKRFFTFTLAAITLAAFAGLADQAAATVIYSDTFSRTTGSGDGNGDPNGGDPNVSDWGTNDNGLGGSNAQAWVADPTRAGGGRNQVTNGSQGVLHGGTGFYDFDATTVAPNGFSVALDFSRFVTTPDPGPGGGGYIAFGLGIDAGAVVNDFSAIGASDWAILFQQANNGNAANANVFTDNSAIGSFDYLTPDAPHTLLLTVVPAVPGAYGETDVININVLVDGVISNDYATVGGANFGSFAASANNFDTRFIDNLVVTAIPEPTSVGLMVLAVAGASARLRKR